MLKLYQNIKIRRLELGMSQTKLAELTGYADKSAIAKIEKGIRNIPYSKLLEFAVALKTTPSDLMGTTEDNKEILLEKYDMLNDDGRAKLMSYLEDIVASGRYNIKG